MSMTAGPHLPKAGWMTRWLKQSAQLVYRCPEVALLSAAFALGVSIMFMTGGIILKSVGISVDMAVNLMSVSLTPLALWSTAIIMNRIMIADLGAGLSWTEVHTCAKRILPRAMLYAAGLALFSMALDFVLPSGTESESATAQGAANTSSSTSPNYLTLFSVMVQLGGAEMLGIFLPLALLHPFALAAVLGNNFSESDIDQNNNMLRVKSYKVHTQLFFAVAFLPLAGILFPGILSIFFIPLLVAWNYVGGREVVGGIDKNGKGQEQTEFKAAAVGAL